MKIGYLILALSINYAVSVGDISEIGSHNHSIQCIQEEREALLLFKQGIQFDNCGLLTSWGDHQLDCCKWRHVSCDRLTGHVIQLHLGGYNDYGGRCLQGKISPSLLKLKRLKYLDLSFNSFKAQTVPDFIGSLANLEHLDLSHNDFEREIPPQLANLSRLIHLDLSFNSFQEQSIPSFIGSLPNLEYLSLAMNQFQGKIPRELGNLSSLTYLDLSGGGISGPIPKEISNLKHLAYLDLSSNNLMEELSSVIHSLSGYAQNSLRTLDLSFNQVWGSIPDTIRIFSSMRELGLAFNELNGTISKSLGQLSKLEELYLHANSLEGTLSEHHLSNLSSLSGLFLSSSKLVVNITANWIPPFQLDGLYVASCKLGPRFPDWLLTQNNVTYLDISNTGISDTLPRSFWKIFSYDFYYLNVSSNNIFGVLPPMEFGDITDVIDFSYNHIEGMIPSIC